MFQGNTQCLKYFKVLSLLKLYIAAYFYLFIIGSNLLDILYLCDFRYTSDDSIQVLYFKPY